MRRLGALPARPEQMRKALRFARYALPSQLPPPPPRVDWTQKPKQPWGMMLNDKIGCCTIASVGHAIQVWTGNVDPAKEVTIPDTAIVQGYSAVSGYDPRTGRNDNGAVIQDALNYARKVGVGGHKIGAYVLVNHLDQREVMEAANLFGGVYLGVSLPLIAQEQKVWDVPEFIPRRQRQLYAPNSWGGHATFVPKAVLSGADEGMETITWGERQRLTWEWAFTYCTEMYGILSPDWFDAGGKAPNGFDLAALQADLQMVSSNNLAA